MGMPELKTEEKDSLDQTPTETKPKSEHEKSEESMEMLKFFDCLSESAHKEVLKNLCRTGGEGRDTKPKNLSLEETRSAMEEQSNTEKACLYNNYMKTQRKKALAKRYVGKIPSHQLQLGLQITLASCNKKDLGEVKVIASPTRSSFLANHTNNEDIKKAMTMAAMKKLPFDE